MITKIAIENFKGIGERVEIELKPITLLFGANSAGKSTVLHALQYLAEILERGNLDADGTVMGGESVDLGGFKNFVHGHDTSKTVWLKAYFSPDERDCEDAFLSRGLNAINEHLRIPELVDYEPEALLYVTNYSIEIGISWSNYRNAAFVSKYRLHVLHLYPTGLPGLFQDFPPPPPGILPGTTEEILLMEVSADAGSDRVELSHLNLNDPPWDSIRDCSCHRDDCGDYANEELEDLFDNPDETVISAALSFCRHCFEQINTGLSGQGNPEQVAPILLFKQQRSAIPSPGKTFQFALREDDQQETTEEGEVAPMAVARELAAEMSNILLQPLLFLTDYTRQFRYLAPIRDVPPRDFRPIKSTDVTSAIGRVRWASGLGAWEALGSNADLIKETNYWLSERLEAGYSIDIKKFMEVDLSNPLLVKLMTGRAFDEEDDILLSIEEFPTDSRLVLIPSGSEVELEPADVGIGISQVLPVIVTTLTGESGIQMIEQPELHLHPRLQAELGDIFIEMANKNKDNQIFLLETHSEHLILRLMRRIRESESGVANDNRQLRTDDLAIHYLKQVDKRVEQRQIDVDVKGEFIQPWPDDFFEIDFYERFGKGGSE